MKSQEVLSFARSRCNNLKEIYQRQAENYDKLARISRAGSYVCYMTGALSVAHDPSLRSAMTSAVIVSGGAILSRVKKELMFSRQVAETQVEGEQNFLNALEQQLNYPEPGA